MKATIALLLLMVFCIPIARERVEPNLRGVIWSDAEGYYIYLPAAFVIGDFHKVPEGSMNLRKNEHGEVVMKYTCGVALLQMPFFLAAKAYCDARKIPKAEIYNIHYARSVAFAGFFATFLGLFLLVSALKRRGFSEIVSFLTALGVFAGTNLFYYATKEPGMSHPYSFFLFAWLTWHTPRFLEKPNLRNAFILGAILGWIVLIRPTGILAVLFVLLYDVYDWNALRSRVQFFTTRWKSTILTALGFFLLLLPQLLYWKEMTGQWIRYSYEGETFEYWSRPKIAEVLFDVQNGLFLYSPLVLLAVIGIFYGWQKKESHAPGLALIFILATYIFASWWAWWFGGAFGHRCYIEYYAFLAFPMASMIAAMSKWKSMAKTLSFGMFFFLIFVSLRFSFLYTHLGGPWDGPEWRWNFDKYGEILERLFQF